MPMSSVTLINNPDEVPRGKKLVAIDYVVRGTLRVIVDEDRVEALTSDMPLTEDDLEKTHGVHTNIGDYTDFMDNVEFTEARVVEKRKRT